jgi:hypothetical protein
MITKLGPYRLGTDLPGLEREGGFLEFRNITPRVKKPSSPPYSAVLSAECSAARATKSAPARN